MATTSKFQRVGGAFFRVLPDASLAAENDPTTLRQLQGGQLSYDSAPSLQARTLSPTLFSDPSKVPNAAKYQAQAAGTPSPLSPTPTPTPTAAPSPAPASNPADGFNQLMLQVLQKAQGVDTSELLKRKRALDRAVVDRTSEITPDEMRTLSPGQQDSIRSGNVNALKPEIDENAYQIEKANQSIDNFTKVYQQAAKISQDFADKMVAPDQVIQAYKTAIEADPSKMSVVLSGANDKTKQAVIGALDYSKLQDKAKVNTQVVESNGRKTLINADTGATIKDLGSAVTAVASTQTERTQTMKAAAIKKARPELEASRGKVDHYVDPNVYTKLRSDYASAIGNISDFDAAFALMLSPQERARLGVGKAAGVKAEEDNTPLF